jgi:PAS domain S-box-containing protein
LPLSIIFLVCPMAITSCTFGTRVMVAAEQRAVSIAGVLFAIIITVLNYYILRRILKTRHEKRSHTELFISREWFSKMLLSMGEAVIATDKSGRVTSMNNTAEELTGWTLAESQGKPIDDIFDAINDHTQLSVENPIKRVLSDNRITFLANHTILIKKDKTQRYIVDSAVPMHNESLQVIGGVLIFRDITELTFSRKRLAEKEELLECILENSRLLISLCDPQGNYVLVNAEFEKTYGMDPGSVIGKVSSGSMTSEEVIASENNNHQVLMYNQLIEFEQVIHHSDGTLHHYHTSKFPLHKNHREIVMVCTISLDITESKRNVEMTEKLAKQEILLKSELRYDELTQQMPNMLLSLDHSSRFSSFNEACERFTGKPASQVIGKTCDEAFPGDTLFLLPEYKEVREERIGRSFTKDFTYHGNSFTFRVNIYPTEKGVSILFTDMTSQKRAEAETLQLVDRLQIQNRDLRQFAYALSHDLRAPISRTLALISLSVMDPAFRVNNKTVLEAVKDEVINLDTVVKDMNTTISTKDEGKEQHYITFDQELKLIKNILEREISESKATITSDFERAEGVITVRSYLYSIMYNLLSNSLKYRSLVTPLTVEIRADYVGMFICLSVKDNGMGIDLTKHGEKLFGLYNRFHGHEIDGKGVGLNLVKTQAGSIGGKVEVESTPGVGSIFKVFFPLTPELHARD